LDAGLARVGGGAAAPAAAPQGRTLTILYGTETGNGRALAKDFAEAAAKRGLAPKVADMADYKVRSLKDEQDVLIIVSTHGEGDPPESAKPFFEFVEGARAPKLADVRYSVLALGDSTYEKYCEAGKRLDRRFEELGAERLGDRVDCDVDYDEPAESWSEALVEKLAADVEATPARVISLRPMATATVHDKRNPFPATVLENIAIVSRHSSKETRHVELDLSGSGLKYQPGDALGFVPKNDPAVVEQLLEVAGLSAEAEVTVKSETLQLAEALQSKFEITIGSPRFIEQWAKLSDAAELHALVAADAAERVRYLEANHISDIIRRFPVTGLDAEALLAGLRPLQPRLYSIASSQAAVDEEAHLTVAPVRYDLHGSARGGVASTQVADRLQMGDTVPVYIQENPHFRLPGDDIPIIMVGPGTGVAPFRAFLQEREGRAASGRSWLFFGERNRRSDFLYQIEWQQWLKDGVLTNLDVAFSRDSAEKVYVQHRMLEQARELYAWLEDGAHFYVCGDEKAMSRDVHEALLRVIETEGGHSREAAEDYVRRLSAEHRYQKDVY
jgi:sulfite reductase (NADPH) flavoprotein alpha-component